MGSCATCYSGSAAFHSPLCAPFRTRSALCQLEIAQEPTMRRCLAHVLFHCYCDDENGPMLPGRLNV